MTNTSSNFFERHSKIFVPLIMLIIVFGMDFLFGAMYRVVAGHPWSEAGLNRAIMGERGYRTRSEIYHHGFIPNAKAIGVWGPGKFKFATDSLGFKNSAPKEIPLSSDKHRVLFIGDSFTEGVGFSYDDTFVGIFAETMAGQNIEVMNAAVASYSPAIYWAKIKHLIEDVGLKFDEVIVYIDLSDLADDTHSYKMSEKDGFIDRKAVDLDPNREQRESRSTFLRNNTILTHYLYQVFLRGLDDDWKALLGGEMYGRIGREKALWTIEQEKFGKYGEQGMRDMVRHMDGLGALLKRHDIELTVAVYPWPDQIVHNDLESIHMKQWRDWAELNGAGFINHFPDFITAGQAKDQQREVLNRYFLKNDVHWNKEGHKKIAERLITFYNNSIQKK